jgi:hypothetical protein
MISVKKTLKALSQAKEYLDCKYERYISAPLVSLK